MIYNPEHGAPASNSQVIQNMELYRCGEVFFSPRSVTTEAEVTLEQLLKAGHISNPDNRPVDTILRSRPYNTLIALRYELSDIADIDLLEFEDHTLKRTYELRAGIYTERDDKSSRDADGFHVDLDRRNYRPIATACFVLGDPAVGFTGLARNTENGIELIEGEHYTSQTGQWEIYPECSVHTEAERNDSERVFGRAFFKPLQTEITTYRLG